MKQKIIMTTLVIILLANATSAKAENWNMSYKHYSHNLYQQGKAHEARQLGRWFKARQNQRNGSTLDANEIMNLHYRNDLETKEGNY